MELPYISCRCLTFGRVATLQETIQSFLQQDYPSDKKELVIVNDYPLQKLIYEHPQIKIFNLERTFPTLGEKENFCAEQCKSDIVALFDDDDCELPNHLTNIAKYFKEDVAMLHWNKGIFYNEPNITAIAGIGNAGMVYSKRAWEESGRYPIENCGHDNTFVLKLKTLFPDKCVLSSLSNEEVAFMYMWGGRGFHASGGGTDRPDRPNIIQRHSEYIESQRKLGKILTGIIELQPRWNHDYSKMLTDFINKRNK